MSSGVNASAPHRRVERLATFLLILFPGAVAFLLVPTAIFLANQAHFYYDPAVLAPPIALLIGWAAAAAASSWLPERLRIKAGRVGFWTGMWLLGKDFVAPLEMSRLVGFEANPKIAQSAPGLAMEIAFSILVIVLALAIPFRRLLLPAAVAVGALITLQIAALAAGVQSPTREFARARLSGSIRPWLEGDSAPQPNDRGNIYHVVLDCYSSYALPTALDALGLTASALKGFLFFPGNRANYDVTAPSVASFMSGSFYERGSLNEWRRAWTQDGLVTNLMRSGYTTWLYPAHEHYEAQPFHYMRVLPAAGLMGNADVLRSVATTRLVPTLLRPFVFTSFDRTRLGTPEQLRDYMRALVDDEATRPGSGQYVYMHLYLPHGPYGLDERCNTSASAMYLDQAICATRLLFEFLYELRRLNRYDSSTIVVQGDHGCHVGNPVTVRPSDVNRVLNDGVTIGWLDRATAALLLVKPPGRTEAPLRVSDRWTQLADIPRTIYDFAGLPFNTLIGNSVVADDYPAAPTRDVFIGYLRYEGDRQRWFGRDVLTGDLDHYVWSPDSGWSLAAPVSARWD